MSDPLQVLLQGPAKPSLFPPNSRYAAIDTGLLTTTGGKTIVYLHRRFVPSPERFALLQEYTVVEGDRLDNLSAKFIGDSERFWQICDANAAMLRRLGGKTQTIGLVLEDVANPFSSALHRAIEDSARARNVLVFAGSCDEDPRRERELFGFPAVGDPYWTDQTVADVQCRYPRMDMTPYSGAVPP